jgi:peptidoglycan/xylan/chitin deacetylase (PgdA/CDA1 family)
MIWYQSIPSWLKKLLPSLTWEGQGEDNTVYLTFDDGPHPEITPWVIDQLKQYNMKATFFCVGDNARKFPETIDQIKQGGHQLGNHTMHHIKGWNTSTEDYIKDIEACQQYVPSDLFRPPYGRISREQIKQLKQKFRIIMWTILSCDFDKKLNQEKALRGLINKTRKGSIIVFHDSVKAENNLRFLLPNYLQFLNQKGYTCKIL